MLSIHAVCKVHGLLLPAEALEHMLRPPLRLLPSCRHTLKPQATVPGFTALSRQVCYCSIIAEMQA